MKFSWKMILLTTAMLSVSISFFGYYVLNRSFESQLYAHIDTAQEDMQLFSLMLRALTSTQKEVESKGELKGLMQELSRVGSPLYGYEFSLWNEEIFFSTQRGEICEPTAMQESYVVESSLTHDRQIVTTLKMQICGLDCCVIRQHDVSLVYAQTDENLSRCQIIMLALWLICVAMTTLFTMLLTRPLSKIARTARELSEGHYYKRANVRSNDELGQLAQDFNTMAQVLEQKIAELADALRRQKEFTASFAHELKTPLTSVIGYADTLRSRELPPKQRFDAADYIVSEGKRLEAMSFALLDLFALEKQTPELRLGSIEHLAQRVEKSCLYLLEQKKISLRVNMSPAQVRFEAELLHTLLYNLIDNARKASEEGGRIFLEGKMTEDGYLICVTDEGRGMPEEALSRLTEPFYMVDKSRARAEGGAGLGLALCQKIAQLHGSNLQFESEVGKGTRVSILLGGERE